LQKRKIHVFAGLGNPGSMADLVDPVHLKRQPAVAFSQVTLEGV
jgi:hypothetical protein